MFETRLEQKTKNLSLAILHVAMFLGALSGVFFSTTRISASEAPVEVESVEVEPGEVELAEVEMERPRFVSLRSDLVNMREGPSTEHSVKWVYHREGLPMQVLAEYDVWRRVRDQDGEIGWIHVSLLANERGAVVVGSGHAAVRADESMDASIIAQVEPGVVGRVVSCGANSCRLDFSELEGWIERTRIWGVYADEQL
jgi:SH3-like domain-containing protein